MSSHLLTIPAPLGPDGKPLWLRLNGGTGNRYARNAIAQQWRQQAAWQAKVAHIPKLTAYPVRIVATIHLDTKPSRWDATNWLPTAKHCVDGLVWSARHGGADVLTDDSNRFVLGPDMRAGDQWADAALVLSITELEQAS
jgi:hypothetical protein